MALVHRSRVLRDALAGYLAAKTSLEVVALLDFDPDPLQALFAARADVVLIGLAGAVAFARLAHRLVDSQPRLPVVVFDVEAPDQTIIELARARIAGCVTADARLDELEWVTRQAADGQHACSLSAGVALYRSLPFQSGARSRAHPQITRRETEVLRLASQGLTNKQIAQVLCIELSTVKNHLHNVYSKLEVRSRGEAQAAVDGLAALAGAETAV